MMGADDATGATRGLLTSATERVREFHQATGHPVGEDGPAIPQTRLDDRVKWLLEEVGELKVAQSVTAQVDALIDLMYFTFGAFVEMGIDPSAYFEIVHRANMEKSVGEVVRRPTDDKILKSPEWRRRHEPAPHIARQLALELTGRRLEIAEPDNCVVAALTMALDGLGITVPQDQVSKLLPTAVHAADPAADVTSVGIRLGQVDLREVMDGLLAPVTVRGIPADRISELSLSGYLDESLRLGRSVIAGVDASVLYPGLPPYGHVVLIVENRQRDIIVLDPGPATAGVLALSYEDLVLAIRRRDYGIDILERVESQL